MELGFVLVLGEMLQRCELATAEEACVCVGNGGGGSAVGGGRERVVAVADIDLHRGCFFC